MACKVFRAFGVIKEFKGLVGLKAGKVGKDRRAFVATREAKEFKASVVSRVFGGCRGM
jgi:hypothetical protein